MRFFIKKVEYIFVISLQILSETLIILRKIERDMVEMFICAYVNYT